MVIKTNKLVVVALTRDDAQILKLGFEPGTHPEIAECVVDSLTVDLENLSEGEILALARTCIAALPL